MGGQKEKILYQEGQILAYRLEYHNELVKALRKQFKLPALGLPFGVTTDIWLRKVDFNIWETEISKFMANLKIPQRHFWFVRDYLVNNDSAFAGVTGYPKIDTGIKVDPESGLKKIVLYLDADTKPTDLADKSLWKQIRLMQQRLPDYKKSTVKKPIPNLEAYKQIFDWHTKDKLSYKQINTRLPELGMKPQQDYQTIGTLIARYKKYIGVK